MTQTPSAPASGDVDILFFEIAGQLYGVDAKQVVRVDRPEPSSIELAGLGKPSVGSRSLVFGVGDEEAGLKVDLVRGISAVGVDRIRRMPSVAMAEPYAVGVYLDGEQAVVLIDLVETRKFQGRQRGT